jgi:hypothetical protein
MDPQNAADERHRRNSMAQVVLGLADDFEPEYLGDEDLNPIDLPALPVLRPLLHLFFGASKRLPASKFDAPPRCIY